MTCCSHQAPGRKTAGIARGVIGRPGLTDPDASGRRYRHGTLTAYNAGDAAASTAGLPSPSTAPSAERPERLPFRAASPGRRTSTSRPTGSAARSWYPARDGRPGSPSCGCMTCATRTRPGFWPVARTSRWSRNASATPHRHHRAVPAQPAHGRRNRTGCAVPDPGPAARQARLSTRGLQSAPWASAQATPIRSASSTRSFLRRERSRWLTTSRAAGLIRVLCGAIRSASRIELSARSRSAR